jgi:hypothetical protein
MPSDFSTVRKERGRRGCDWLREAPSEPPYTMNPKRIASLLRELAAAFEEEPKPPKRRKPVITPPKVQPTKEALADAKRALRRNGFAV